MTPGITFAQLAQLPTAVDLVTAAAALGIGRTTAYRLASSGTFPVRVLAVGRRGYRVATADLIHVLGAAQIVSDLTNHKGESDAETSQR